MATSSPDKFPSGTWSYGPIVVSWDIVGVDEVDVSVTVLGIPIDKLKGTLTGGSTEIRDDVTILGIVTGYVGLLIVTGQPSGNGVSIEADLKIGGTEFGPLRHLIVPL